MKKWIKSLEKHFQKNPPDYDDAESLLDMIYWHYTEFNSMDKAVTDAYYEALREKVKLTPHEYDEMLDIVGDLCLESERLAFMEGLMVGMVLMQEVTALEHRKMQF